MATKVALSSIDDLPSLVSKIHDHFDKSSSPITGSFQDKRSLDANAQVHVWVPQIAAWMGESGDYVRKHTKMHHGLPTLLTG